VGRKVNRQIWKLRIYTKFGGRGSNEQKGEEVKKRVWNQKTDKTRSDVDQERSRFDQRNQDLELPKDAVMLVE